jgi:hypothetical protein
VHTLPKSGSFDLQYYRERKNRKTGKEGDFLLIHTLNFTVEIEREKEKEREIERE